MDRVRAVVFAVGDRLQVRRRLFVFGKYNPVAYNAAIYTIVYPSAFANASTSGEESL